MIEWQNDKDIFGRMFILTGDPIFKNLRNAVDHFDADLSDALSWGQLKSKKWLDIYYTIYYQFYFYHVKMMIPQEFIS